MKFREIQIKSLTEHLFCDRIVLHSEGQNDKCEEAEIWEECICV